MAASKRLHRLRGSATCPGHELGRPTDGDLVLGDSWLRVAPLVSPLLVLLRPAFLLLLLLLDCEDPDPGSARSGRKRSFGAPGILT